MEPMSDITSQARNARTHLMQALGALQQDDVPPNLQAVAEGVAQAMSLLHRIETKGEQADTANEALSRLRAVLNVLQAPENEHPTAESALEVVASSLGMVHQLARGLAAGAPAAEPPPRVVTEPIAAQPDQRVATQPIAAQPDQRVATQPIAAQPDQRIATQPIAAQPDQRVATQPIAAQPDQRVATQPIAARPGPGGPQSSAATQPKLPAMFANTPVDPAPNAATPAPLPPTTRNAANLALGNAATQAVTQEQLNGRQVPMLPPEPAYDGKTVENPAYTDELRRGDSSEAIPLSRVSSPPTLPSAPPSPFGAPASASFAQPTAERAPSQNPEPQRISSNPVSLPVLPALPGEVFVEAALGAYSTTNFFKGLSGNDIIDAGGLFIATYAPPEMGQHVRIHVSLPGGFEFQARGEITWVREMPKSGSLNPLSPPGYGVKFTEISKEARQLVYRYVRNREPLFHDDL
jgi:hypothetical protein